MATSIKLGRKTPANTLATVQNDEAVWSVGEDLTTYLRTLPLSRVTSQGVLAFIKTLHPDATLTPVAVIYMWIWDDVLGWVKVCLQGAIITVPTQAGGDPVLITVEESARYS